jgi:succinate dehydrogenase / fumarate reductase cytochrome b subunit
MATSTAHAPSRKSFYRGGESMFTWVLHRVTGVVIFTFLFAHILDTALIIYSPALYDGVLEIYHHPLIKLMEIGLVVAILYHAVNGIRVTLVDFWSKGSEKNKSMLRVQWVVFVVLAAGAAIPMTLQLLNSL